MNGYLFRPCRANATTIILTRGGSNARQARMALPRADMFGPFGAGSQIHIFTTDVLTDGKVALSNYKASLK